MTGAQVSQTSFNPLASKPLIADQTPKSTLDHKLHAQKPEITISQKKKLSAMNI